MNSSTVWEQAQRRPVAGAGFSRIARQDGQRGDRRSWLYVQEKSCQGGTRERPRKPDGVGEGLRDWRAQLESKNSFNARCARPKYVNMRLWQESGIEMENFR